MKTYTKKEYVEAKINTLLAHEINVETEEVNELLEIYPASELENRYLYIGVLTALKRQAKDLIDKL
jgi:hypothetical protein